MIGLSHVRMFSHLTRLIGPIHPMKLLVLFLIAVTLSRIVKPGIDGDISILHGEKVGIISNPTGVNFDLVSTIDILAATPSVQLTSLFGPEHGIRGDIPPGRRFENYIDPFTNLPVYSLYSRNNTGTPEPYMLRNVTALVFDIQDVGARCYTYISTMVNCLKSAKANGVKKFVILDRPNPIGGDVEGNLLETNFTSFVGIHTLPMKHGMTMGELALLFNKEMKIDHQGVHVVKITNYDRKPVNQYKQYGWILPSPNIPNYETAVLYPGTVIFESAHLLSLGRGTTTPFIIFGAPYVNPYHVIARLKTYLAQPGYQALFDGVKIVPNYFTPTTSYHKDVPCAGVQIVIVDRELIKNPIGLGLTLYKVFLDLYADKMDLKPRTFQVLTGTDKIWNSIRTASIPSILQGYHHQIQQFKDRRRPFLLYPE